jgi:hypothetical protein
MEVKNQKYPKGRGVMHNASTGRRNAFEFFHANLLALPELCLDILQSRGLAIFGEHHRLSIPRLDETTAGTRESSLMRRMGSNFRLSVDTSQQWDCQTVFGKRNLRNLAFQTANELLTQAMQSAFAEARLNQAQLDDEEVNFIASNFAHYVVKSLLDENNINNFNYLELRGEYLVTSEPYNADKIIEFKNNWLQVDDDLKIAANTKNKFEQGIMSNVLAGIIINLLRENTESLKNFFASIVQFLRPTETPQDAMDDRVKFDSTDSKIAL